MVSRSGHSAAAVALAVALTVASAGATAAAEDQDASQDPFRRVSGAEFKPAGVKVAGKWIVINDPVGDLVDDDGVPVGDVDGASDIVELYAGRGPVTRKFLNRFKRQYPSGKRGSWGDPDRWKPGQEGLFTVAKTAEPIEQLKGVDMQLVVSFDGNDSVMHQAGEAAGVYTGNERFTMNGGFDTAGWLTFGTSLEDHEIDQAVSLFNGRSHAFGYYDPKTGHWVNIVLIPKDADTFTVSLRTQGVTGIFDHVRVPDGGRHIGLGDGEWP